MIKNNKKGALELSLNLIIMLVIGLTVLGLIIAFVTGFLGSARGEFEGKLTQDDTSKIDQASSLSGNFAFLEKNVELTQGSTNKAGKIYFKVRNSGDSKIDQGVVVDGSSSPMKVKVSPANVEGVPESQDATDHFKFSSQPIILETGGSSGYMMLVYPTDKARVGTYFAAITLSVGPNEHTEIVTISVK